MAIDPGNPRRFLRSIKLIKATGALSMDSEHWIRRR
jgi:hypothetical protein